MAWEPLPIERPKNEADQNRLRVMDEAGVLARPDRWLDVLDLEDRALTSRETALHAEADKHFSNLSVALRYAFAAARKTISKGLAKATTPEEVNVDAALRTLEQELLAVLPGTLTRIARAGGVAAMAMLEQKLRSLGGPGSGHHGHAGRPGKVGGSQTGEDSEVERQERLAAKHAGDTLAQPDFVFGLHSQDMDAAIRYVGAYGEHFKAAPLGDVRRGRQKECYKNASLLVLENPDYDFAEGFAKSSTTGDLVFAHAWAVDRATGEVIDPTWDEPEKSQYFGIRYDRKAYLKYLYTAKIYGVLGSTPKNSAAAIANGGKNLRPKDEFRAAAKDPFTISFNVTDKKAAKWAKQHAAKLAKDLTSTSEKAVKRALSQLFKGNKNFKEVHAEILKAVGDELRADVIARTEIMTAVSEGQRDAWAQAVDMGLLSGKEKRVWITVAGACPECEALEGTTAKLGGTYKNGAEGPPLHPNCRCTEGLQ